MPTSKLKPCPAGHDCPVVCGDEPSWFRVECRVYECWFGPERITEAEAIAAWNKRDGVEP